MYARFGKKCTNEQEKEEGVVVKCDQFVVITLSYKRKKLKFSTKKSISFVIDICMRNPYSHNKFIQFVIRIYEKLIF